ncbi:hypothetical protein B0J13DRAFT_524018 [Dactylonectria estremocensis]|uniref:Uncharacterized protein n=1 Tax=Dactylonectria estremocensis TaxID=1079267 RepID=A0A9P9J9M0_9HYPO|nr:hypothetical protein B0J13DRAFT_524018 [Dactylonectria estremocensis]
MSHHFIASFRINDQAGAVPGLGSCLGWLGGRLIAMAHRRGGGGIKTDVDKDRTRLRRTVFPLRQFMVVIPELGGWWWVMLPVGLVTLCQDWVAWCYTACEMVPSCRLGGGKHGELVGCEMGKCELDELFLVFLPIISPSSLLFRLALARVSLFEICSIESAPLRPRLGESTDDGAAKTKLTTELTEEKIHDTYLLAPFVHRYIAVHTNNTQLSFPPASPPTLTTEAAPTREKLPLSSDEVLSRAIGIM